jgi:hypothetical protein
VRLTRPGFEGRKWNAASASHFSRSPSGKRWHHGFAGECRPAWLAGKASPAPA